MSKTVKPTIGTCRHCSADLKHTVVDLGSSPLCNELIEESQLNQPESFYPLHAKVCAQCFLVQVDEVASPDTIFSEYSYFSSFSDTFVEHARVYVENSISRFDLTSQSLVMEVASNDGYLLQHYLPHEIPVLGIEPALNVAQAAKDKGIPTTNEFLGTETAQAIVSKHGHADLVVANNVVAHTPVINDFVHGISQLLKPTGVSSLEFASVLSLLEDNLYDTIYHEHFCYLSLYSIEQVLRSQGLTVFDAEELSTHGGSLRVWSALSANRREETDRLVEIRAMEMAKGVTDIGTYTNFRERVEHSKRELLRCLLTIRDKGQHIVGYGVPGKGNTMLNYCGIRTDFLDYMVDRNPYKQGRFTPGTRIPIHAVERISETKPDFILIMPWNIADEIIDQLSHVREWGCQFIIPLPEVRIV